MVHFNRDDGNKNVEGIADGRKDEAGSMARAWTIAAIRSKRELVKEMRAEGPKGLSKAD